MSVAIKRLEAARPANFDRVARAYQGMERLSFGRALERCRTHLLPMLSACRTALVLGDGDGRFLTALLAANPQLSADAVDASAAMLRLLARRAAAAVPDAALRLRTHHGDAVSFTPPRRYDLVVSHFFLDCLTATQLDRLCANVVPRMQAQALWLFSDFRIPEGRMQWPVRAIVRGLYLGFRLLTGLRVTALPDHAAALTAAGLRRTARHLSLGGMLTTELWQVGEYTPVMLPTQRSSAHTVADPVPDPEPASPSLPGPDPGVFKPGAATGDRVGDDDGAIAPTTK